jgi:uncharacterized repeat protein (TIGR01451 family)
MAVTASPGVLGGFQQDGNQVVDNNPDTEADDNEIDWASASVRATTIPFTDDTGDTGFQGSSKELKPSEWTCNTGGSDPSKGNLLRTYINPRPVAGYIDLAWVRQNLTSSGDVEVDYELNQEAAPEGDCAITRAEGDILIAYKFPGGESEPNIEAYRWSPHAVPTTLEDGVWEDMNLQTSDVAAKVNFGAPLSDDLLTAAEDDAVGSESFGEATVSLRALFGLDSEENLPCRSYGYANIRSKSSRENGRAALQDRMPPQDVSLNTCGAIKLKKVNDHSPAQPLENAGFSLYDSADSTEAIDTCSTDSDGFCTFDELETGSYWIRETTVPDDYNGPTGAFGPVSVIEFVTTDLTANPFVNNRKVGFIEVSKNLVDSEDEPVTVDDLSLLDGATFVAYRDANEDGVYQSSEAATLWPAETATASCTISGGTGACTIGPLPTGDYRVTETAAPSGTLNTSTDTDVTVTEGTVEQANQITMTNSLADLNLNLVKDGPAAAYVGDTITYTFTLTTTGPGLHDVSVTEMLDSRCDSDPTLDAEASSGDDDGFLEPDDSWVFTCPHLVTAADLTQLNSDDELENTAYASGTDDFGRDIDSSPDDHQVLIVQPGIKLTKTVNGGESATVTAGDNLNYVITITNTGNVALTLTTLTDSLHNPLPASCAALVGTVLAAGASTSCSYTDVAATGANTNNVAVVDGVDTEIADPKHKVTSTDSTTATVDEVLGEVFTRDLPRTGGDGPTVEAFALLGLAMVVRRVRRRSLT